MKYITPLTGVRQSMVWLIMFLIVSIAGNIFLFYKLNICQKQMQLTDERFKAFSQRTSSIIASTAQITKSDLWATQLIEIPPYMQSDREIISLELKKGYGIRFLFDENDALVGWEPYLEPGSERK